MSRLDIIPDVSWSKKISMRMTIKCNVCDKENPGDAQVCARCGVALMKSGIPVSACFELTVIGDENGIFPIESTAVEGYVIGRSDDGTSYLPDIDLAAFGAREQGISRRHAALVRYHNTVHIIDLGSVNGTYLNGRRLVPEMPLPINIGDSLRLGNLHLLVSEGKT